jgi:hypothetical protein
MPVALIAASLFMSSTMTATIPFTGPGVNTHAMLLPVDKLRDIGIRWIRADLPVREFDEHRLKELLNHYRGMPVLWMLTQLSPTSVDDAKKLVDWGFTDIECGNEPDLDLFNPGRRAWTPEQYAHWFTSIRQAVGNRARLYGPVTCTWTPAYIQQAFDAGMRPDGMAFHGYSVHNLADIADYAQSRWSLPTIVTEVGPHPNSGDVATAFMDLKNQMGERPWCWYDGPKTDWRGLFDSRQYDKNWQPTPLYNEILRRTRG